jgi:hypothetical protein
LLDSKSRHAGPVAVWVPSYTCPSVPEAVAQLGLSMRSYNDRPGLTLWTDPPTPGAHDIVIIIHYFGILNRAALEWVQTVPTRSWDLIEDCVQAPYTSAVGAHGEYVITSLRKWWPAPDGAQVCANQDLTVQPLLNPDEQRISRRLAAKLLRGQQLAEVMYLELTDQSERSLEAGEIRRVSWLATHLLQRADPQAACRIRRANWAILAAGFAEQAAVQPLFRGLDPGEVPLAFPILVPESREELRRFLMSERIFCPVHWTLAPDAPGIDRELSQQMLSIPLDQRYGPVEMHRVLSNLNRFFSGSGS